MLKFTKAALVFALPLALFSCASNSLPAWVDSPGKEYPSISYITGIGSGTSRQAAESSAKLELCKTLGEKISGEQSSQLRDDTSGNYSASMSQTVNEQVLFEKIVGVNIKENISTTENGKQVFYALAVLNKSEAVLYYSQKISSLESEISTLIKSAKNEEGTLRSVSYMNKALALAEENEDNLEILSSIQGMRTRVSYGGRADVRALRSDLGKNVRIFVNVSGDDSGRIATAFQGVFTDRGLTVVRTGDFEYLFDANISFEELTGIQLPEADKYKYVRYNLSSNLSTSDQSTMVMPFDLSNREGHLSFSQAKVRAVQKIIEKINGEFSKELDEALEK